MLKQQQPKAPKESRIKDAFIMILAAIFYFFVDLGETACNFFRNEKTRDTLTTIRQIIIKGILIIALVIVVGFLGLKLLGIVFRGASIFWSFHGDKIITVLGVVGVIYWWVSTSKKDEPPPPIDIISEEKLNEIANQQQEILTPNIYDIARGANGLCGLAVPVDTSDIWHKPPFTIVDGVITHHFDMVKANNVNTDCSTDFIKQVYRKRIWQRLSKGTIQTVSPRFVNYDGRPYPALVIDGVHDKGLSVRIDVKFASEAVLSRLDARERAQLVVPDANVNF